MPDQHKMETPTGSGNKQALLVTFDNRLKVELHCSKIMSDVERLSVDQNLWHMVCLKP